MLYRVTVWFAFFVIKRSEELNDWVYIRKHSLYKIDINAHKEDKGINKLKCTWNRVESCQP